MMDDGQMQMQIHPRSIDQVRFSHACCSQLIVSQWRPVPVPRPCPCAAQLLDARHCPSTKPPRVEDPPPAPLSEATDDCGTGLP